MTYTINYKMLCILYYKTKIIIIFVFGPHRAVLLLHLSSGSTLGEPEDHMGRRNQISVGYIVLGSQNHFLNKKVLFFYLK